MRRSSPRRRSDGGFTLFEILIAAVLLLIVFFGLAQIYSRGRRQLGYEEDRRKATEVAQARLDGIRRDFRYDDLPLLDGTDTTLVVDNRPYVVSHEVTAGTPEDQTTTVGVTVSWSALVGGSSITRDLSTTTILARGMP